MKLIWTLAVTGIAVALGGALVLRWLGAAGLPVPLAGQSPVSKGDLSDRRDCITVFTITLLFRILVFLLVALTACLVLYPGSGPDAALWV